jgi:hypothetical protein
VLPSRNAGFSPRSLSALPPNSFCEIARPSSQDTVIPNLLNLTLTLTSVTLSSLTSFFLQRPSQEHQQAKACCRTAGCSPPRTTAAAAQRGPPRDGSKNVFGKHQSLWKLWPPADRPQHFSAYSSKVRPVLCSWKRVSMKCKYFRLWQDSDTLAVTSKFLDLGLKTFLSRRISYDAL